MNIREVIIGDVVYNSIQEVCRIYDIDRLYITNKQMRLKRDHSITKSIEELLNEEIESRKISEASHYFLYGRWSN